MKYNHAPHLVKGDRHDSISGVKGLLHAVSVVNVNVDVHNPLVVLGVNFTIRRMINVTMVMPRLFHSVCPAGGHRMASQRVAALRTANALSLL
jgi:hypothetical protein